jgi:hypothetical protein
LVAKSGVNKNSGADMADNITDDHNSDVIHEVCMIAAISRLAIRLRTQDIHCPTDFRHWLSS